MLGSPAHLANGFHRWACTSGCQQCPREGRGSGHVAWRGLSRPRSRTAKADLMEDIDMPAVVNADVSSSLISLPSCPPTCNTNTRTSTVLSQVFSFLLRSPSALNMVRSRTNSSFALGHLLYPLVACTFGPGFLVADPETKKIIAGSSFARSAQDGVKRRYMRIYRCCGWVLIYCIDDE
jgi:hypothetical protein